MVLIVVPDGYVNIKDVFSSSKIVADELTIFGDVVRPLKVKKVYSSYEQPSSSKTGSTVGEATPVDFAICIHSNVLGEARVVETGRSIKCLRFTGYVHPSTVRAVQPCDTVLTLQAFKAIAEVFRCRNRARRNLSPSRKARYFVFRESCV